LEDVGCPTPRILRPENPIVKPLLRNFYFGCTVASVTSQRRGFPYMKTKQWDRVNEAARKAQKERAAAIMARVAKEEPIAQIARELGVTRQRVSQIVQRERRRAGEAK
jgi:DNA-directed RNA polymerase specialized sigma24 family protein